MIGLEDSSLILNSMDGLVLMGSILKVSPLHKEILHGHRCETLLEVLVQLILFLRFIVILIVVLFIFNFFLLFAIIIQDNLEFVVGVLFHEIPPVFVPDYRSAEFL